MGSAKRKGLLRYDDGMVDKLASLYADVSGKPSMSLPIEGGGDMTFHIPLTLLERRNNRVYEHDVSLVKVTGDIFHVFDLELQGRNSGGWTKERLDQLKLYLQNKENPKYHFFLLDSKVHENITNLNEALFYLREMNLFNRSTLGISLIVSKCDQLSPNKEEWTHKAVEFVKQHYLPFVTELKRIVGDPRNGGLGLLDSSISVIPFSIGEVFFRQLCLFDPESAESLVRVLMKSSPDYSFWNNRFLRRIRS